MYFYKNESGRSMIEILAVLAIIGVLTITALVGYWYAVTKREANDIVDGISKARITLISAIDAGNHAYDIGEGDSDITDDSKDVLKGYGLNNYGPVGVVCGESSFDVVLDHIKPSVCKRLVDGALKDFVQIDVQDSGNANRGRYCLENTHLTNTCNDEEEMVRMVFSFDKNGAWIGRNCDAPCAEGQICVDGACVTPGVCDPSCAAWEICNNGVCEGDSCGLDSDCPQGTICGPDNECIPDPDACSAEVPVKDIDGNCHACDTPAVLTTTSMECAKCPTEREYRSDTEHCIIKDSCDGFLDTNDNCYPCDYLDMGTAVTSVDFMAEVVSEECSKCSNREWVTDGHFYSNCQLKCPSGMRTDTGVCYSCQLSNYDPSIDEVDYIYESECNRCSNRDFHLGYGYWPACLMKCDDGQFKDENGICRECDDLNEYYFSGGDSTQCDKCPNREFVDGYRCIIRCGDHEFRGMDQQCHSCDEANWVQVQWGDSDGQCAKCSNREMVPDGDQCRLKCGDNEFRDYEGACHSCDGANLVQVQWYDSDGQCAKCSNREMVPDSDRCRLKCGDNEFRGYEGACHSCDEANWVRVQQDDSDEQCVQCANRELTEKYGAYDQCVLKCDGIWGRVRIEGYWLEYGDNIECVPCNYQESAIITSTNDCASRCSGWENISFRMGTMGCVPPCEGRWNDQYKKCCSGFIGYDNECYSCDESNEVHVSDPNECAQCSNRDLIDEQRCMKSCGANEFRGLDGSCYSCNDVNGVQVQWDDLSGQCAKCSNRELKDDQWCMKSCGVNEFRDQDGRCQSCETNHMILVQYNDSDGQCAKCPNRELSWDLQSCGLKCGANEFRDTYGSFNCISCDDKDEYYFDYIDSTQCDRCPGREFILETTCILGCDYDEFWDYDRDCRSCYEPNLVRVSLNDRYGQCAKCPEREMIDEWNCAFVW